MFSFGRYWYWNEERLYRGKDRTIQSSEDLTTNVRPDKSLTLTRSTRLMLGPKCCGTPLNYDTIWNQFCTFEISSVHENILKTTPKNYFSGGIFRGLKILFLGFLWSHKIENSCWNPSIYRFCCCCCDTTTRVLWNTLYKVCNTKCCYILEPH